MDDESSSRVSPPVANDECGIRSLGTASAENCSFQPWWKALVKQTASQTHIIKLEAHANSEHQSRPSDSRAYLLIRIRRICVP